MDWWVHTRTPTSAAEQANCGEGKKETKFSIFGVCPRCYSLWVFLWVRAWPTTNRSPWHFPGFNWHVDYFLEKKKQRTVNKCMVINCLLHVLLSLYLHFFILFMSYNYSHVMLKWIPRSSSILGCRLQGVFFPYEYGINHPYISLAMILLRLHYRIYSDFFLLLNTPCVKKRIRYHVIERGTSASSCSCDL